MWLFRFFGLDTSRALHRGNPRYLLNIADLHDFIDCLVPISCQPGDESREWAGSNSRPGSRDELISNRGCGLNISWLRTESDRSAFAPFRLKPARRSFTWGLPVRQVADATHYTRDSGGFIAYAAAPIAIGWNAPVRRAAFAPFGVTPSFRGVRILYTAFPAQCLLVLQLRIVSEAPLAW